MTQHQVDADTSDRDIGRPNAFAKLHDVGFRTVPIVFVDRVPTIAQLEQVRVRPRSAIEDIIAGTAIEHIISSPAAQRVVARATFEPVVQVATQQFVVASAGNQQVVLVVLCHQAIVTG